MHTLHCQVDECISSLSTHMSHRIELSLPFAHKQKTQSVPLVKRMRKNIDMEMTAAPVLRRYYTATLH